jgi:hypothetical protein
MGAVVRPPVLPWRATHGGLPPAIPLQTIPVRWWQDLLYNQRALLVRAALLFKPSVIVTSAANHMER